MRLVEITEEQVVKGVVARTSNAKESDPNTGSIAGLWQAFGENIAPLLNESSQVFGAYFDFESDVNGEYSAFAGTNRVDALTGDEFHQLTLKTGKYLVFSGEGEIPQMVIETWGQILNYFADESAEYQRAYTTDFEKYLGPNAIEVYVGVK